MIDCNITKNYFIEKVRMTKRHKLKSGGYACKLDCTDCPLSHYLNGLGVFCSDIERIYPEQAISIVQRWSDAHPPKTYLTQFLEHYPNVQLYDIGIPKGICPYHLGLMNKDDCKKDRDCVECWNQSVMEGEE